MKISFIIGTRPELIKVAPVIWEAKKRNIEFDIVNTGQHRDLLEPYWIIFKISPTHTLNVMKEGQNLSSLTSRALNQIQTYIDTVERKPDVILAQGDTTTVMASAMVSFYNAIKFAHLGAGLRSFDLNNPFPEEFNRKVASISAAFHLCPTIVSKANLLAEGVVKDSVHVVGNTVVDALDKISSDANFVNLDWKNSILRRLNTFEKVVLITCHRRENQGANLTKIIRTIIHLSEQNTSTAFVWTLHPNPNVQEVVLRSELSAKSNVLLVEPLDYYDILKLLKLAFCAISDSGGIQEEAPSFETPVIVLREATERPEGVDLGVAFLAGANQERICHYFDLLKSDKITFSRNPYGDGYSSKRIIDIIYGQNKV